MIESLYKKTWILKSSKFILNNKGYIMEIAFLKAKAADLDEIANLYKDVIANTFTTWDENYPSKELLSCDINLGKLYVAKINNEIIGVSFLGAKENDTESWNVQLSKPMGVARICVSPKVQGKGIGSRFMNFLIDEAKKQGADGMHFHVCTENISAMKMYEKCGFKNYGLGKSDYGFDYYKYEQSFK